MEPTQQSQAVVRRSQWSYWTNRLALVGIFIGLLFGVFVWPGGFFGLASVPLIASIFGAFGAMIDAPRGAIRGGIVGLILGIALSAATYWSAHNVPQRGRPMWEALTGLAGMVTFLGASLGAFGQIITGSVPRVERAGRALKGTFGGILLGAVLVVIWLSFMATIHSVALLITDETRGMLEVWPRAIWITIGMMILACMLFGFNQAFEEKSAPPAWLARTREKQRSPWIGVPICTLGGALMAGMIYGWHNWFVGAVASLAWVPLIMLLQYGFNSWVKQPTNE